jgi:hypothetical protein
MLFAILKGRVEIKRNIAQLHTIPVLCILIRIKLKDMTRIRIRIKVISWIRIRIKVKGRIRIQIRIRIKVTSNIRVWTRIKVMLIRNTDCNPAERN